MAKVNPYAENTPGAELEAKYNACQTCEYAMDHRMMLQCCHPQRASIQVYDITGRPESAEGCEVQYMSNYCVEPGWWCKKYEACGYDNNPGDYSKKHGGGAVGGAAAGS